ncbi:hypothetical protein [uncultured Campylobacter sp.]|uniref:hypothetical protein n=1 Tax=uncultured Campylobacter sp. TaxID=218934 RepID=UPI002609C91C|nr:hypothetical protein [uncultured Campylobacter sp.]
MKYALGAVLATLISTGCGADEIQLVKDYTLPDFKSMSIGTAIEGSKICKNITWSKEENSGLKTVKMVCDVDVEQRLKSYKQEMLDSSLKRVMTFYEGKAYDAQGLFKPAKEYCKLNEAKFQETLKNQRQNRIFEEEWKSVDCDDKLKGEILKESNTEIYIDSIMERLKAAIYYSQITAEQLDASFGHKEDGLSKLAIELNFIVNEGKSVTLSDKFKLITNGKEDPVNKMKSKDVIAGFYERQ